MKSIKQRFDEISFNHPGWSSLICFVESIRDKEISSSDMIREFNKLVEKDDYDKHERDEVIEFLKNTLKNINKTSTFESQI